jgi:single-strand DNA-binding protein
LCTADISLYSAVTPSRSLVEVQYHNIIAWRGLAEIAAEHLSKGRLVYVGGRLHSRTWTAPDGTSRFALEIIADDIQFLTPKPAAASAAVAA